MAGGPPCIACGGKASCGWANPAPPAASLPISFRAAIACPGACCGALLRDLSWARWLGLSGLTAVLLSSDRNCNRLLDLQEHSPRARAQRRPRPVRQERVAVL